MGSWKRTFASLAASAAAIVIAVGAAVTIDSGKSTADPTYQCGDVRLTESQIAAKFGVSVEKLHKAHYFASVTNETLCSMKPEHLAKAFRKAEQPKPDHPGEAVEFRNLFYQDENGTIPEGALMRAKAELDQLRANPDMVAPGAGITSGSWTALGPGNIGGRVRSILINPSVPATMLLGSVSGGIWRTTNSGGTWTPVQDFMANLAVSTMAAQPSNFNIQYAGTGEGFYNADGIRGAGIFKSTNGGTSWAQLASTTGSNFQYVNRLAISPNSATVLAATRTGIFRSTDAGVTFPAATLAGGPGNGVTDVDFHPTDSTRAVASGYSGNAWYSTDGGATFQAAAGMPGGGTFIRVEIAYAPSSPNIVYASVDTNGGSLYKSTDFGVNYSLVFNGSPDYLSGQGWYDNALFVDPTNPNFLIVGGVDLYSSTNGGVAFTRISRWDFWPASAHADHHVIVPVPGFNGTSVKGAYFGNDGGIYGTTDIYTLGNNAPNYTNGWQEYNNNLAITQFYGAGAHEASGKVMGGTQDNGTLTYTTALGSEGWVFEFGGDGGWSAIDQTDANYCYGEYVYLQIHRSSTGCGAGSGSYIYSGIGDAGASATANFIAPFILDPNDQSRLLAGGRSLWRTSNAKAAPPVWASIKAAGAANISAIAVQQGNANHVWVGHNNGNLFKSVNGLNAAPTWTQLDNGAPALPNRVVTRVAVDRNNAQIIYATFGGYTSDNIWKSVNGGTTWTNIHGSLPAAPIRSIVLNPGNSNWLYIGTEVGLFTSENGGASWVIPHDGPANVSVDEVFFAGSTLYAATHGRGVYKASTGAIAPGKVTQISPAGYVNDTTPTYRWNSDPQATWYLLWVDDATGNKIAQWYTEAAVGCAAGGVCEVTPATVLAVGAAKWWVQTWNPTGYGPWSDGLNFNTGLPTAQVLSAYPVSDVQPGYTAQLWVYVRNTGSFALPAGSQAWIWVTGPGFSGFLGYVDVSGLAAGTNAWYLYNWDVPVGRTAGVHTYWGRVWNAPFAAWISDWGPGQSFNVLATPVTGARIVSTYQVDGVTPGGNARTWALVRNIGSAALTGRVWFHIYNVGWTGYADISGLASGAQAWYFADWAVPAAEPTGTHWYLAQVYNTAGTVSYSPASPWQAFTVGFNAQFTTGFNGFAAVTGAWSHTGGAYLFTAGTVNTFDTVQYAGTAFTNLDYTARIWRNGDDTFYHGIYARGTPAASFWSNGYMILLARLGQFSVWKTVGGSHTPLQNWTASAAVVPGSAWNTVRFLANGSSLYLYINGTLVWSGTDATFSSGQVGIAAFKSPSAADASFGFWADYATLGGFGAPVPNRDGEAAAAAVITDKVSPEQEELNREANRNNSGEVYTTIPPANAGPRRPDGI